MLLALAAAAQRYDTAGIKKAIEKLRIALAKADPRLLADLFVEDGVFANVVDSTICHN